MLGELYFTYVVTLGRDLPYLPTEVRKKILQKILYTINCLSCNEIIVSFKPMVIAYTDEYSFLSEHGICSLCESAL